MKAGRTLAHVLHLRRFRGIRSRIAQMIKMKKFKNDEDQYNNVAALFIVCKFQHHRRGGIHDHNYCCTRKQLAQQLTTVRFVRFRK